MNPGGEPERDETGLPPVDIEIPDDARELERDVQAYYRERRALRRQQRRTRWHRWLGREGVVLPLLACCLILALITGTLLTVFTATSDQNLIGSSGPSAGAGGAHPGSAGPARSASRAGPATTTRSAAGGPPVPEIVRSGRLPRTMLTIGGRPLIQASALRQAMLVVVPPQCGCGATLGWLADVAARAHAAAYVVYTAGTRAEVEQLYGHLSPERQAELVLAQEADGGILTSKANRPDGIPAGLLTAILVGPDGQATYASRLDPRDNPAALLQAITA